MPHIESPVPSTTLPSQSEQMFPALTPAQVARVAAFAGSACGAGSMRAIRPGEVLIEAGAQSVPFFVVVSGEIEIVRPSGNDGHATSPETLVAVHHAGQFT